ncbi:hypothetical protein [Pedobacter caeni]|uniref:Uncharacterized protein n=1 Tax=Pedobacter caeni TaxID=288992 RepID=A0A1M5JCN3_9SPHI|nr:hypothetical protein [Pedobacter caeni]SHG38376.1 hypothetical protein SAMN04488522_105296 [Pedobacter caeni]
MARLKGKFLIGTIGNLTFKTDKKGQILQRKIGKGHIKQTKATKTTARVFGKASSFSLCVRKNFGYVMGDHYDGEMVNRFNKENFAIFRQCYQPETERYEFKTDYFQRLNGFDFNVASPLKNSLWLVPSVQLSGRELLIRLPDCEIQTDFKFPTKSNICTLELMIYLISIRTGFEKQINLEPLQISNDQKIIPAREWKVEIPDGCICITGMLLYYYDYHSQQQVKIPINHKEFNPAAILDASVSDGEFNLPWDSSWQSSGLQFQPKIRE